MEPVRVKPFEQEWGGMTLFIEGALIWPNEAEVTLWESGKLYRFRGWRTAVGALEIRDALNESADPKFNSREMRLKDWAAAFVRERMGRLAPKEAARGAGES